MPRDFIPCVYREWEEYDAVMQVWNRRYDVIECFALEEIATRKPCMCMTRNSHAFHVGTTETALDRLLWPTPGQRIEAQRHIDREARARLFTTFYAAVAALE